MSFDIYFLPHMAGVSWEEALESLEDNASIERPLTEADRELWRRLDARLRDVMPDAEAFEGERNRELTHEPSGIQISLFPGELTLTAPYWYSGSEADDVVALLRRVASVIEDESGLVAYDPQAEAPFLAEPAEEAAGSFNTVAQSFGDRGVATGRGSLPNPKPKRSWRRFLGR